MIERGTGTTHWHTQWDRRDAFIEGWEKHRRTVIRGTDVDLVETARRMRQGPFMGPDAENPTRQLDATMHEIDPGVTSTVHRHSWDAIMVPISGSGWTEIGEQRVRWRPWDGVHLPAWTWHRSGNDGDRPARLLTSSSQPLMETLNMAWIEDAGDASVEELAPAPRTDGPVAGNDPYARRVRRVLEQDEARRQARLHLDYDEHPLQLNPKGTRSKFLNDAAVGQQTSGLTQVMLQFAPGYHQSMHRHPGEAWLYVVEGRGHTYLGVEPEGGEIYEWSAGDLIVVDHWLWHQHFNDVPDGPSRLIRIHMFASMLETMRAVMAPQELFEEKLGTGPALGEVEWPPDARPQP